MSAWDLYTDRMTVRGTTKRETAYRRETMFLGTKVPDSLSFHTATIFKSDYGYNINSDEMRAHAIEQNVAIINSDNLNEKTILSMPGEDIEHGSLVEWMDNYWLVTERDANTTLYTRAKLLQCNYLLRWVSEDHRICEQWCVVEDGTKYLTGEMEDRWFITTRGDSRIAVTIARNALTVRFGRANRFLIDDPASPNMMAYTLSKPMKLGENYNGNGIFKFVMQEVVSTDDDNQELRIADYYKHFPKDVTVDPYSPEVINPDVTLDNGRKVWL